jgi:hypothetical protein
MAQSRRVEAGIWASRTCLESVAHLQLFWLQQPPAAACGGFASQAPPVFLSFRHQNLPFRPDALSDLRTKRRRSRNEQESTQALIGKPPVYVAKSRGRLGAMISKSCALRYRGVSLSAVASGSGGRQIADVRLLAYRHDMPNVRPNPYRVNHNLRSIRLNLEESTYPPRVDD